MKHIKYSLLMITSSTDVQEMVKCETTDFIPPSLWPTTISRSQPGWFEDICSTFPTSKNSRVLWVTFVHF